MREIIFDTETTGLKARDGDRVIEIGAVELVNGFPTGRTFHQYLNPEGREVHPDAEAVHGIGNDQLKDKPTFRDIFDDFFDFFGEGTLIAHNAKFDMGFLDAEMVRLGKTVFDPDRVVDTLEIARRKHPNGPNSLDALCRRYGISNAHRTLHGALLDSELLAEVYLELTGGKQAGLGFESDEEVTSSVRVSETISTTPQQMRPQILASNLSESELQAHMEFRKTLGDKSVWSAWETADTSESGQ